METSQKLFMHDLIAEILSLEKNKVITANQTAPKPTKTYCTLRYYSHGPEIMGEQRSTSTAGIVNVFTSNTCMLEIQMYANTGTDACSELNKVVNAFDRESVQQRCKANYIAIADSNTVQDITALLDNATWEIRASVEIEIRYNTELTDDVGYVDTVTMQSTVNNLPTQTITVTGGE
jgi:hypothetical protein